MAGFYASLTFLLTFLLIIGIPGGLITLKVFIANKFDWIAKQKGYNEGYWAWVFFTSIIGMLMVIALPDRAEKNIVVKEAEPKPEELPEI